MPRPVEPNHLGLGHSEDELLAERPRGSGEAERRTARQHPVDAPRSRLSRCGGFVVPARSLASAGQAVPFLEAQSATAVRPCVTRARRRGRPGSREVILTISPHFVASASRQRFAGRSAESYWMLAGTLRFPPGSGRVRSSWNIPADGGATENLPWVYLLQFQPIVNLRSSE